MHTKRKGNIGQFAASLELSRLGFSVFTEEGDISKIDLVAEKDGVIVRIQCKACFPINNRLALLLRKSGKNYKEVYKESMVDLFSLYDLKNHNIYFIPSSVLQTNQCEFLLRLSEHEFKKNKNANFAEDFLPSNVIGKYLEDTPL